MVQATWFNQPYLVKRLKPGKQIVISGKVDEYLGRLTFPSPTWEPLDKELIHTKRLVPVYPLTQGIGARWLRRLMKRTTDYWCLRLPDHLPLAIREKGISQAWKWLYSRFISPTTGKRSSKRADVWPLTSC